MDYLLAPLWQIWHFWPSHLNWIESHRIDIITYRPTQRDSVVNLYISQYSRVREKNTRKNKTLCHSYTHDFQLHIIIRYYFKTLSWSIAIIQIITSIRLTCMLLLLHRLISQIEIVFELFEQEEHILNSVFGYQSFNI